MIVWVTAQGMAEAGTVDKRIAARLGAERAVVAPHPSPARNRKDVDCAPIGPERREQVMITSPGSREAAEWEGWSTQLAPAIEPIIVARRPCEGKVAVENVLRHGCGAMNIAACGIGNETRVNPVSRNKPGGSSLSASLVGWNNAHDTIANFRWPKNVMLDELAADLLDLQVGERRSGARRDGARSGMGYRGAAGDGGPAIEASAGAPWIGGAWGTTSAPVVGSR